MDSQPGPVRAVATDAPTGPIPIIADTRIHTLIVDTGDEPWEAQRVLACALRRRSDQLATGEGICPVVDARVTASGVAVDLRVPPGTRAIDRAGGIAGGPLRSLHDVIGLLTPIVESLAGLHDAGLAHGGIEISAIRVRADGRGVLIGFDPEATQSSDIAAIGGIALDLLPAATIPGQLASILTRAVDRGDHRPPTMAEIARALADLARTTTYPVVAADRLAASPPAHRRMGQRMPVDCDAAEVDQCVDPLLEDPLVRLRRSVPRQHARHAAHGAKSSLTGRRAGITDGRPVSRPSVRRPIPWPLVATALGSSILTWAIVTVVG